MALCKCSHLRCVILFVAVSACAGSKLFLRTHDPEPKADSKADSKPPQPEWARDLTKVGDDFKKGVEGVIPPDWHHPFTQPLMSGINALRCAMCVGRPDLLTHGMCLEFLSQHCQREDDGAGYCSRFWEKMKEQCTQGEHKEEKSHCEYWEMAPEFQPEAHKEEVTSENATIAASPASSPAASPMASPAPAPAVAPASAGGLPDQGYGEVSSKMVEHENMVTYSDDWRKEWPMQDDTENGSVDRICEKHPDKLWCKMWSDSRATGRV